MAQRRYRGLPQALAADVAQALAMATGGALGFAVTELIVTPLVYPGSIAAGTALRFVALVATLSILLWIPLALGFLGVAVVRRAVIARQGHSAAHAPTWLAQPTLSPAGIAPEAPAWWATFVTAGVVALVAQRAALWAMRGFKEQQLSALLVALLVVGVLGAAVPLWRALRACATAGAEALAPLLGVWNPLGRRRASAIAMVLATAGALAAAWWALPQLRTVFPLRLFASACVVALSSGFGAKYLQHRPRSRRVARIGAPAACVLVTCTLVWWGADLETRYIAITASPPLTKIVAAVRLVTDLDRDGYGSLLGDLDCAPFDRTRNPDRIDKPDDGIDQDCDGRDARMSALVAPAGPIKPVPPEFVRDWNVLLITIDTLRYDHTTFGTPPTKRPQHELTPRLAELAARSTSYSWCQAPSAGTMASIPAILTSKFFHSGLALQDRPGGIPPKVLPQNTTLPEIMKRKHYATGVIGTHNWWTDWGLDQGVDDFDNTIGAKYDPFGSTANRVTDHALAWMSRHQTQPWFLWAHYIDPHGRYVAHPDVADYGADEPGLYQAEIRWTDQEVGRLLAEVRKFPTANRTLIIVTSDHGESMAEHRVPQGTHGTALYTELIHVPLIFYIPGNRAQQIGGAVSNLDIVPTVAELTGIDVSDLGFEGRSLAASLFYGIEDHERVVFSETNAPDRQRAATSSRFKLIRYINSNLYELFDVKTDPMEKHNLAPANPPELQRMKTVLQQWMDRVLNARDPVFNQAYRQIADVVLSAAPAVGVRAEDQRLEGGAIEILGIDLPVGARLVPGKQTDVHVYFHVVRPVASPLRFALATWSGGGAVAISQPRPTAAGAFASNQWKTGDYIRERFTITVPPAATGALGVGLVTYRDSDVLPPTGAAHPTNANIAVLGQLPIPVAP